MKHETKFYNKIREVFVDYFGGDFFRWQDEQWGRPDFFGHDKRGRLVYVEVKIKDEPLRPLQRDFYRNAHKWHTKACGYPLTLVARMFESTDNDGLAHPFIKLMNWGHGVEEFMDDLYL